MLQTGNDKKVCTVCGMTFPATVLRCPEDGLLLEEPDPLVGTVFDTRYLVQRLVGQGGMSVVYLAKHIELDRTIALKLLKSRLLSDPTNIQRFRREAQAASLLNHPNINAIYSFGVADWQPYLALEYLDGKNLAIYVQSEPHPPLHEVLSLFVQMADALAHAHAQGVIHRDLKPSNVVVCKDNGGLSAKIVDFGTAQLSASYAQQDLTQAGEVLGTLQYMSPEQKRGEKVDRRADIYALGYMLFEMTQVQGAVNPAVQAIVDNCVAESPEHRYQTAAELKADLCAVRDGLQSGGAPRVERRSHKRSTKTPVLLGLCCLALLATICGVAWSVKESDPLYRLRWLELTRATAQTTVPQANATIDEYLKSNRWEKAAKVYDATLKAAIPECDFVTQVAAQSRLLRIALHEHLMPDALRCNERMEAAFRRIPLSVSAKHHEADADVVDASLALNSIEPFDHKKFNGLMEQAALCEKHGDLENAARVYSQLLLLLQAHKQLEPGLTTWVLTLFCDNRAACGDSAKQTQLVDCGIQLAKNGFITDPNAVAALFTRKGNLLRWQGKILRAEQKFQGALALHPDPLPAAAAQVGLATCAELQQQYDQGIKLALPIYEHPPAGMAQDAFATNACTLADCYFYTRQFPKAAAVYEVAYQKLPMLDQVNSFFAEQFISALCASGRQSDAVDYVGRIQARRKTAGVPMSEYDRRTEPSFKKLLTLQPK